MIIDLPSIGAIGKIDELMNLLGTGNGQDEVSVDFTKCNFYDMSSIVALVSKFFGWSVRGNSAKIFNFRKAHNYKYLQRMNFFDLGNIETEEDFVRRQANDRFVELKRIGRGGELDVARLSTELANCIAPELSEETDPDKTGFYDCVEYAVSELMNNVIQHSRGSGVVGAQHYKTREVTQIVIADNGIGIWESFIQNGSPIAERINNHKDAIHQAILPRVSSRAHLVEPWGAGAVNAGVGLTLLRSVALQSGGDFIIISGNAVLKNSKWFKLNTGCGYDGTYVAFSIKRAKADAFEDYLEKAKIKHGLMDRADDFSNIFE